MKEKRTQAELEQMAREALGRAASGTSIANYATIFGALMDRGIPESEILPRENVFTYHAWRALGRQVRRGEHGVKIAVWIPKVETDTIGKESTRLMATTATVFHISQTDKIEQRQVA